jgi:hypothetical protein
MGDGSVTVHSEGSDSIGEDDVRIELHYKSIQLHFGSGLNLVASVSQLQKQVTASPKVGERGSVKIS